MSQPPAQTVQAAHSTIQGEQASQQTVSGVSAQRRGDAPTTTNRHTSLLLLLLVAAALGAGVLWLREQNSPPPEAASLPPELRDEPDLYVNAAIIHQFFPDGSRKYLLRADTVSHFDRQQLTRLAEPDLLLDPTSMRTEPWQATADFGYVRQRPGPEGVLEEVVFLRDNVELIQTSQAPRSLSIRTQEMYLYPDREYVETSESVTIDTHTGRTTAEGMRGNLATGELRLLSDEKQVQTIVLPFQFK